MTMHCAWSQHTCCVLRKANALAQGLVGSRPFQKTKFYRIASLSLRIPQLLAPACFGQWGGRSWIAIKDGEDIFADYAGSKRHKFWCFSLHLDAKFCSAMVHRVLG